MSDLTIEPLTINEVVSLFRPAQFPWWIAGGWGLDLFLGAETRPHADTDVLVLRRDQPHLQAHLKGWDVHAADPPGTGSLRPWAAGESLQLPVHEMWCRRDPAGPWQLEIMLGETDDGDWVFRRHDSVTRPLENLGFTTTDGMPCLVPEVQLLFKAKHLRPKDEQDFRAVVPKLDPSARWWLRDAVATSHPGHPWLERL